jgi:hypothetical protein
MLNPQDAILNHSLEALRSSGLIASADKKSSG